MSDEATTTTEMPEVYTEDEATEVPEAGNLYVLDVPDEARDAMITSIKLLGDEENFTIEDDDADRPVFANWDELEEVDEITKSGGVWVDVKCMVDGSQLLMGDAADALREQSRLDRLFRKQHPKFNKLGKDGKPVPLPDGSRKLPNGKRERNVQHDIFVAATYGTAVRGWRGPGFCRRDGAEVPFNEENYRRACRFNYLSGEILEHMGNAGISALELVRGN